MSLGSVLKEVSSYFWSAAQIALLTQAYREGSGLTEAEQLIPEKTRSTIAAKASRMGLTNPRPRKPK